MNTTVIHTTADNGMSINAVVSFIGGKRNQWRGVIRIDCATMAMSHHSTQDEATAWVEKMHETYMKVHSKKNQSGSILPEICWLFATLLLAALFIVPTVRHYDAELTARINHSLDLRK